MADANLDHLRSVWNELGETDPLWAILSDPSKREGRWDIQSFLATGRREIEAVLKSIALHAPDLPRGCAFDFGCGVGRLTRALAPHFQRVIGIDIAPSMIRRACEINADLQNCEFRVNERPDLSSVPSGSVDLVYSNIVIQHIPRPYSERFLQEFVRVLSPHGLAVIQIPYAHAGAAGRLFAVLPPFVFSFYRRIRYGRRSFDMHAIPVSEVHAILERAGGRIVHLEESDAAGRWKSKLYFVRRV